MTAQRTTQSVAINAGPTRFTLQDPPDDVDAVLYDALAWEDPNAQFIDAYQNGHWDGMRHLYDRQDHAAPIGLLERAKDALESDGYDVDVADHRDGTGHTINADWKFPHDLRDYQREAVRSVVGGGGGLVSLPTGAGKTVVALRVVREMGRSAIVFTHTQELLYQWVERIRDVLDVDPGVIGDGEWSEGPVTVAVMQTLLSRGTADLDGYDIAVFDECHRTSAAESFHTVGQAVDAPVRVGLSATPWRKVTGEELKIEGAVGGLAYEVDAETLIDAGHLARPEWSVIDPADYGTQATAKPGEEYQAVKSRCLIECEARNRAIADTAADLARDGRRVLVSVGQINHGKSLRDRLADSHGVPTAFLCGEDTTDRRQDVLEAFGTGELDVLVSTLVREGVDIPAINAVALAEGGKSKTAKIQTIGRALRPENGDTADVVDVRDSGEHLGDHFETRQAAFRDYYGRYGPGSDSGVRAIRRWLESEGLPTDAFRVTEGDGGRFVIDKTGYLSESEYSRFIALMRDTAAVSYDGRQNYVNDPSDLPGVR